MRAWPPEGAACPLPSWRSRSLWTMAPRSRRSGPTHHPGRDGRWRRCAGTRATCAPVMTRSARRIDRNGGDCSNPPVAPRRQPPTGPRTACSSLVMHDEALEAAPQAVALTGGRALAFLDDVRAALGVYRAAREQYRGRVTRERNRLRFTGSRRARDAEIDDGAHRPGPCDHRDQRARTTSSWQVRARSRRKCAGPSATDVLGSGLSRTRPSAR